MGGFFLHLVVFTFTSKVSSVTYWQRRGCSTTRNGHSGNTHEIGHGHVMDVGSLIQRYNRVAIMEEMTTVAN